VTAAKQYRWKCPQCSKGVNAPGRMRRDDVRRFCLDCSKSTGRLVEREAPALEASRAKRSETAAAKRKREQKQARERTARQRERTQAAAFRERDRAAEKDRARHDLGGEDVREIAKRMWNLPAMRAAHKGRRAMPRVQIARRDRHYTTGHAYGHKITVTYGPVESKAQARDVEKVVLHELVHCAVGVEHWHDHVFTAQMRRAAAAWWPGVDWRWHESPTTRGYATDWYIMQRLHEHFAKEGS
jgi:predicted SprT family Zn-dependent metalloprotease